MAHHPFCHLLLAKANHTASSVSRGGENDCSTRLGGKNLWPFFQSPTKDGSMYVVGEQEYCWNQGGRSMRLSHPHPSSLGILFSRNMECIVFVLTLQMGVECFSVHMEKDTIP